MSDETVPTIYEWAGGAEAFERLIMTFYDLAVKDELLRPLFQHMSTKHRHYVALWFGELFGGPKDYSKVRGDMTAHPYVINVHLSSNITEPQRARWINLMLQAADIVDLPDDPEFRSAFVAYLEWGSRMNQVFMRGTPVPKESPMPSWGWGERKPYVEPKE